MNVVVADDERIILRMEADMIKKHLPGANVEMFSGADECLDYAENNSVDIAFLDIELEAGSGIELAKKLKNIYPKINIIFCTGYSEYTMDALDLYCSGYLLKPVTDEKLTAALKNLRYPVSEKIPDLYVACFGNFEVLYKGNPVRFRYAKTREMFAYLIDRKGAVLTIKEIMAGICENDEKESYIRNLKADLINTFQMLGIDGILVQERGKAGVRKEMINCDYFEYLDGRKELFKGEYMSQYSFAENTLSLMKY